VPGEVFRVSRELIVGVMATAAVLVALLAFLVVRAFGGRVHTGVEGLLHERGVARSDLAPRGKVFVRGELWNAESARPVARGAEVEVVAVKGLTLEVVPRSPEPAMLPGEETS
jgi:membrane-bound serine protease (ClpP class)